MPNHTCVLPQTCHEIYPGAEKGQYVKHKVVNEAMYFVLMEDMWWSAHVCRTALSKHSALCDSVLEQCISIHEVEVCSAVSCYS